MVSRGYAISAYSPQFSKGAKIYGANVQSGVITSAHILDGAVVSGTIGAAAVTNAKMKAAFLSGTLVSGKIVYAIAHGLGVRPKLVVACAINSLTEASAAQNNSVSVAVSAATSTNIYLVASGTQGAAHKYTAYVQI